MPKKIKTATPVVKAAVAQESFDEYALMDLSLSLNPNGKISVRARLLPARTEQDGSRTIFRDTQSELVDIDDLLVDAQSEPALATAYDAVVDAIVALVPNATGEV